MTDCTFAGEFGNPDPPQCQQGYEGVALTLIDSLSTLAVIGNSTEFEKGVWWLVEKVSFCLLQPFMLHMHRATGPSVMQSIQHRQGQDSDAEIAHKPADGNMYINVRHDSTSFLVDAANGGAAVYAVVCSSTRRMFAYCSMLYA